MITPQLHNVDIEDMAPESGAVIQKNFRKVAMYKDAEGRKHAFSALCPHLGCLLQVGHALTQPFTQLLLMNLLLPYSRLLMPFLPPALTWVASFR